MMRSLFVSIVLAAGFEAQTAVVINELFAAPSDRQLSFSNGVPRLGSGIGWIEPDFNDNAWRTGSLPAGFGFAGLATDLSAGMRNKAPSAYFRKEFIASAAQAAFIEPLILSVDINDGFVAYLNGREVARANCGALRRFMYARQPAFNVNTSAVFVDFNLGPANTLLKAGRNVLAIQAHNADQPSTPANPSLITQHLPTPEFKVDARLRVAAATIVSFRPASLNFDDAVGGGRVHANTNGVVSDSPSGSFAPNGWLATAPNPTSSAAWQALQIRVEEALAAGIEGSGALRFTLSQTGSNQPAAIHAPAVNMAGGWEPGGVTTEHLVNTVLRFRARSSGPTQFRLRFDPALGQEANALTGFPAVSPTNEAPITLASAANGARVMTVNSSGGQSQAQIGSLSSLSLFAFASNDVRNMSFRVVEDATIGAGYNGSKGHLRAEITQAATAGSSWGFSYGGLQVPVWTPGSVTSEDLAYAGFQFACKLPAGVSFRVWAEPGSGGHSNRVDWGTITGDGTWQMMTREFAGAPGAENFRTALNAASTRNFRVLFQGSANLGVGTWLQVDDFQVTPWRKYEVRLADATNGRTAFLNYVNGNHLVSFVPTLEKLSDASTPQTFTIDNYEVLFAATNASSITNLIVSGPSGGAWEYFVGLAEPSGGVFDPGLLSSAFRPPAGEEDDFEEPSRFVDWIELANTGPAAVNLSGWSLSDERDTPAKWRFPANTILSPGAHLLVLCDDREEANAPMGPAHFLHAGFSLSSDGEYVGIFDNAGNVVDALRYPRQTSFASYGRNFWNPANFGFLGTATPGTNNAGPYYVSRAEAPDFKDANGTNDLPGGIYHAGSLTLRLTNATPALNTFMRYTLDGSEPTESNGFTYTAPLTLTQSNDKTGIVVRARTFVAGWLPSGVRTHTYVLRQPSALTNVPAMFFTAPKERAFYKPAGILAINGGVYQPASGGGEVWIANGPHSYNEVLGNGSAFEREVHMEYYFPAGYYATNQPPLREDVGLRISSSPYQRARMRLTGVEMNSPWVPPWDPNEKPSFNIFFNGDYGISKLDYRLFDGYDIKEFQHLRLRAGKNDHSNPFITDELVRRLWIDMGHVGSRGLFCSLYLNGAYKGVYNLTERIREPLFQAHHRSLLDWDVCYNYDWVNGDNLAFGAMMSALARDMTTTANYLSAAEHFNADNFADYYLLNIYSAMWDWPENNFVFARERSTNALGRFAYAVWDAEGAFNINGYYSKPVSFNTIAELNTKNVDVANIWKRLALSPEFRLRFADRVHRHMFNGGVLDDRDPDGPGPEKSAFGRHFDALAGEAAPLVLYNSGVPLATNLFTSWTSPTGGRRSYLLGNTVGRQMLRDAQLWPMTEPPVFSQHGGSVPAGYSLMITSAVATAGQTATIYVTHDNTDPRKPGGSLGDTSMAYTSPITITNIVTIKARARNDVTGEWSPLTEASFGPSAVPATADNLVFAEIMYHPPAPGTNELAAGFDDKDSFEFARLQNIGPRVVDLAGVRLVAGITFDFGLGSVRFLNQGASVLVVKSRTAFGARYGSSLDSRIAGEYAGNLANGGERLALASGTNFIRDFFYGDVAPWPFEPDGFGSSLLLRAPANNPDHGLPENWTAYAVPGGMPGGTMQPMTFDVWRRFVFGSSITNAMISGHSADPDADGIGNFAEYLLGLLPTVSQPERAPRAVIETVGGNSYLAIVYTVSSTVGSIVGFQYSSNLMDWFPASQPVLMSSQSHGDGTVTHKARDTVPITSDSQRFLRLRITQ